MGTLRTIAAAVALVSAQPAHADAIDRWRPLIAEAASRFGVPEQWIVRVMRAESGGTPNWNGRPITSSAGAMGLMQLMPNTWSAMRERLHLGPDPYDPRDNILAGTAYLRLMYDRFGYPGLFAAYNAGPGRYSNHVAGGRPLPRETRLYLAQVAGTPAVAPAAKVSEQTVFVTLGKAPAPSTPKSRPASDTLFAIRKVVTAGQN